MIYFFDSMKITVGIFTTSNGNNINEFFLIAYNTPNLVKTSFSLLLYCVTPTKSNFKS